VNATGGDTRDHNNSATSVALRSPNAWVKPGTPKPLLCNRFGRPFAITVDSAVSAKPIPIPQSTNASSSSTG
jgi:hypothetical protein